MSAGESKIDPSGPESEASSEAVEHTASEEPAPADSAEGADAVEPQGEESEATEPAPSSAKEPTCTEIESPPSRIVTVARSLLLAGTIGAMAALAVNFAAASDWLVEFLKDNQLETDQRMSLVYWALTGAGLGAVLTGAALLVALRRRWSLHDIERILWFSSPLILLPTLPLFLEFRAWHGRHLHLLGLVLLVAVTLEVLATRALRSVPERLARGYGWLRERVPGMLRRHGPLAVVLCGALFYAVFMSFYTLRWHFKLQTHVFDLAINNNLMFGGLKGVFMESPVVFANDPQRYLAAHAKYGCYLFLPIYALYPKAETLIVLQSTLLGFGALPLFAFARRHISAWAAAGLALAYLCYYPMHGANFYEVKWVPVASFFLLSVIWAADAKRWVLLGIAFTWTLLLREDMPIALAVVGVFLLLTGHRPRAGLTMALVATAWFFFIRFFVMEQAGSWWFPKMYKKLWAPGEPGFGSVIKTLLSNPPFVFDTILKQSKVVYLLHLLVPIVFLPARRWYLWAAFIPGFILTLMTTSYKPPTMFSFQYVMYWTPFVFVAAALAISALQRTEAGLARARGAVAAVLFASAVLTYNYGAFTARPKTLKSGYSTINFEFTEKERERYANLQELMKLIPPDASVAATERVGAHLSSRKVMHSMRSGPHGADYIVAWSRQLNLSKTKPRFRRVLERGEYGVVERIGDLALLQRGHDTSGNAKLMKDWRL